MHQLHLVGITADHDGLIFSTRRDAKSGAYVVGIDDALFSAIEEARRRATAEPNDPTAQADAERVKALRPTQRSSLSVRDIQSRLRTGITLSEVATEAGVDEDWVARFAAPVLAEQAAVVERALPMTFTANRKGASSRPLGDSVRWNLANRRIAVDAGAQAAGWTALQLAPSQWGVRFSYLSRGRHQVAEWEVSFEADELTARNRLASELGYVEAGARRRQQPEPPAATPASTPGKASAGRRGRPARTGTARTTAAKATTPKAARATSSTPTKAPAESGATRSTAAKSATKKAPAAKAAAAKRAKAAKAAAAKAAAAKRAKAAKAATAKAAAAKTGSKKANAAKAASTKVTAARVTLGRATQAPRPTPAPRGAAGTAKRALGASAPAPVPSAPATPGPAAGVARFPAPRPAAARVGTRPSAPAAAARYQPAPPAPPVARRPEPAPSPRPPARAPAPRVASTRPAKAAPEPLNRPRPDPKSPPPAEAARPAARAVPEPAHRAGLEPTLRRVAPPTPRPAPKLTADARPMPLAEPAQIDAPLAVTPLQTSQAVRRLPSPSAASGRSAEARRAAIRTNPLTQQTTPPDPQPEAQPEAQPTSSRPAPAIVRPVGGSDGRPTILIIDAERASDRRRS